MSLITTIIDGIAPNPSSGLGGANEGHIQGFQDDIINGVAGGVADKAGGQCLVTQNSPLGMSVLVADGVVYVPNADYIANLATATKFYRVVIKAEDPVTIPSNTSGSDCQHGLDVVVDKVTVPNEYGSNIATLVVTLGTPGAGAPAVPDNGYRLAEVEVVNGATQIANVSITDTRTQIAINDVVISANIVTKTGTQTLSNKTLTSPKVGTAILDANGNEVIKTPATTNAVNEITVTNAATGNAPEISVTGADDNIDLYLKGKGSGRVKAYDGSSYVEIGASIISTTKYAPQGFLLNGKIVPSVTSNNLTVALKGMDGNDPSASNPIYVRIGDTVRTITSALSVTTNAGTNWCNAGATELATKEIDYFVYLGYNATDGTVIGFSRIPYATLYSDFSATSTNEKYCAISTITNAAAGDNYENVGRFAATLSAGAGYTWTVPTFTTTNLIQRPIYETRYLSYAITYAGWSANPGVTSNYKLLNDLCFLQYEHTGSTGTSNATTATYTLPMTAANIAGTRHVSLGRNYNNSAEGTGGQCVISGAASTAALYNGVSGAAWTASGGKFWEGTIHYRIR